MRSLLIVLALAAFAQPAFAQGEPRAAGETIRFVAAPLPEDAVDRFLQLATENVSGALGSDGRAVGPVPPEQAGQPLLTREEALGVIDVGIASAAGRSCGLNWQDENFSRLMARERARGDRSEHQIAVTAVLHGIAQGFMLDQFQERGCPDAIRARTIAFYEARWR